MIKNHDDHDESSLIDNLSMNECTEQSLIESKYGLLNWEQVHKLDTLLSQTIPIHGRGNYPTLQVKLKDFIRTLNKNLLSRNVNLKSIRINGGVASYVLAKDNLFEYSDIDIIFSCDLLNFTGETDSYTSPESRFSTICDLIKETVFHCLNEYIPAEDCSAFKEKLTWMNLKEAYVKKMVKVYEPNPSYACKQNENESSESSQSLSRWSLISLFNNQGQNIELKFVDKMKRQFQFSVDAFQIHLDSLLKYYDCQESIGQEQSSASMSEKVFPCVRAESLYGDFGEAKQHLDHKLIATKRPEEIVGGGLLKYCNLLIRGFKPECETSKMNSLEKYMCSRFFIDFSDIKEQEHKLSSYLDSHFQNDSKMCIVYLKKLFQVVNASTVCLMGHERKQTLNLIEQLEKKFDEFYLDDEDARTFSSVSSSSNSELDPNDINSRRFKARNKADNNQYKKSFNQNQNKKQNANQFQDQRRFEYQNFFYNPYAFYPAHFALNCPVPDVIRVELDDAEPLNKLSSSSSTISSSLSSTSTSASPSPPPYQPFLVPIGAGEDKASLASPGSVCSLSSVSSSSSIISSPSPSPPLITYQDENEGDKSNEKINRTKQSRTLCCKLSASSTTTPYIEVFENFFCPPVLPIYYDSVYINQHQQAPVTKHHFYSAPNIITRVMPANY